MPNSASAGRPALANDRRNENARREAGDPSAARLFYEEGLAIAREASADWNAAWALQHLASVAIDLGVTQVVDSTLGCHAALRREIFSSAV